MPLKQYRTGIVTGSILALLITAVSVCFIAVALQDKGGYWALWPMLGLALFALVTIVPLALGLIAIWMSHLRRGRIPRAIHAWMILPTLLALCIIPSFFLIQDLREANFRAAYPPVHETHINLTGKDLWVNGMMSGANPGTFSEFDHYPTPAEVADGSHRYQGLRLRDDARTLVQRMPDTTAAMSVPLIQSNPYPDVRRIHSSAGKSSASESELLTHLYYHYPDRVEVAPALRRAGGAMPEDTQYPLLGINASNLGLPPIVRLEINGQAIALDEAVSDASVDCHFAYELLGPAMLDPAGPLRIRWQTLADPGKWRQATIIAPRFHSANATGEKSGMPQLLLYFLPDGTVSVERFEEVRLRNGELGVRATGLPSGMPFTPPCGTALDRYNRDTIVQLPR